MRLDWEQRYQSLDTPWDKGEPSPGLLEFLSNHPLSGKILVVGCGYGHDVRALSQQGCQVVGVDFAPSAIAAAQSLPTVGDETYLIADIFNLPKELDSSFDCVWEHTCFCAIAPEQRPNYVESVATVLKPGGKLLAVFFVNADLNGAANILAKVAGNLGIDLSRLGRLCLTTAGRIKIWFSRSSSSPKESPSMSERGESIQLMIAGAQIHYLHGQVNLLLVLKSQLLCLLSVMLVDCIPNR